MSTTNMISYWIIGFIAGGLAMYFGGFGALAAVLLGQIGISLHSREYYTSYPVNPKGNTPQ